MFTQENPYDTSKIDFQDINELIKKRNFDFENPFTINYSAYYGIEYSLKEYVGFPQNYEIKGFFEHGVTYTSALEAGFRVHESLPSFTSSSFRKNAILTKKNNGVYAIGPYIAYAKSLLGENETKIEKERLGKNLLVFPAHGTVETKYDYSLKNFTENINKIAEDFDSVRVCLYWKDIERGLDEYYKNQGYEVVTAGYMKDPLFLKRLRAIIDLSHTTISNELGSHTGYCKYLKKPHYLINNTITLVNNDNRKKSIRNILDNYLRNIMLENTDNDEISELKSMLSNDPNNKELKSLMNKYFGFDQVKSRKELKNIILEAEDKFSKGKFYLTLPKLALYYTKIYSASLLDYIFH